MFFVGTSGGPGRGLLAALLLTGVILLGVAEARDGSLYSVPLVAAQ